MLSAIKSVSAYQLVESFISLDSQSSFHDSGSTSKYKFCSDGVSVACTKESHNRLSWWCKDSSIRKLFDANKRMLDFKVINDNTPKANKVVYCSDSKIKLTDLRGNIINYAPMANFKYSNANRFAPISVPETPPAINPVKCSNNLNIGLWNAQSLRQKTQLVKTLNEDHNLDVLLITETWLNSDDNMVIGELERNGECQFLHNPRKNRIGGGIGCLVKAELNAKKMESFESNTFENMVVEFESEGQKLSIITVYRPEPSAKNKYRMKDFYEEFINFLAHFQTYRHEVIVTGDFNFHMNKPNHPRVKQFNGILDMFDLVQHVNASTHKEGNTLDLIITQRNTNMLNCSVGELHSDHSCIHFNYKWKKRGLPVKEVIMRKTRNINIEKFKDDLRNHFSCLPPETNSQGYLDELVETFSTTTDVLDKHAPTKHIKIRPRNPTPWTYDDIKDLKIQKRRAERKWRNTKLQSDWLTFKEKRNEYNTKLNQLKTADLKGKVEKYRHNSKAMFKLLNSSMNRKQEQPLPKHANDAVLANEFNRFFDDKISKIRDKLPNHQHPTNDVTNQGNKLKTFQAMSQDDIKKLIKDMPVKHCQLDPMPTWLMIECLDVLLPIFTKIVNQSLKMGVMPSKLKHALVKPLLKKPGLDLLNKNYRPVSNLSFLGKLIESAVIKQYLQHLYSNNLDDKRQSAYKPFHSTETLLTKIHNDIMLSMGNQEVTMLVMLDLSAAFDTIDHSTLLRRLRNRHGIEGTALKWFESYLSNRTQSVIINNAISDKLLLKYGVPQGSKLGPILFNTYIAPVSEVSARNNINDEKYADDQQLILSFKPNPDTQVEAKQKMEKCIADIRDFLIANKLCNNREKTELIIIGNPTQLRKLDISSIKVDDIEIKGVDHVRNLGVIFDNRMSMEKHVNKMCRNAYFNLKNLSRIRGSLDKDVTKIAINALVTPHLDYGNGLLLGISKKLLNKLQVAQNSAVRLIERLKRDDNITDHRKNLHWLPIPARCRFKILTTAWKALNGQAPHYIKQLLRIKKPHNINLRSNKKMQLKTQAVPGNSYSDRAFSLAIPELWNDLPEKVKNSKTLQSFKKNLKTHLFKKFYL